MKKLVVILMAVLMVTGCSASVKSRTLGCSQTSAQASVDSNFVFENNELKRLEQSSVLVLPDNSQETLIAFQQALEMSKTQIEAFEGATYEYALNDTSATIKVVYDVTKMSDDNLLAMGFSDDMKVNGKFDLAKISEMYKNLGVECVEK